MLTKHTKALPEKAPPVFDQYGAPAFGSLSPSGLMASATAASRASSALGLLYLRVEQSCKVGRQGRLLRTRWAHPKRPCCGRYSLQNSPNSKMTLSRTTIADCRMLPRLRILTKSSASNTKTAKSNCSVAAKRPPNMLSLKSKPAPGSSHTVTSATSRRAVFRARAVDNSSLEDPTNSLGSTRSLYAAESAGISDRRNQCTVLTPMISLVRDRKSKLDGPGAHSIMAQMRLGRITRDSDRGCRASPHYCPQTPRGPAMPSGHFRRTRDVPIQWGVWDWPLDHGRRADRDPRGVKGALRSMYPLRCEGASWRREAPSCCGRAAYCGILTLYASVENKHGKTRPKGRYEHI